VRSTELKGRVAGLGAQEVFERLGKFELHSDELTMHSSWDVDFRGGSMRWTEKDVLDPEAGTITFSLVKGNLREFSGTWSVTEVDGGAEIIFAVRFAIGMPSMASFIDPVAEDAIRENLGSVLAGLFGDAYEPATD